MEPADWTRRGLLRWVGAALPAWALHAAAAEPAELTWLVGDFGVVRDESLHRPIDPVLAWLDRQMPQLAQRRLNANATRSWLQIEAGEPVCHSSAARTPQRERSAYFSNIALFPTPQVWVRRERAEAVPRDVQGHADLARLLADPGLRGVLVRGRSYGAEIDAWVAARPDNPAVQQVISSDFGHVLWPLLQRDRADYAIEYPLSLRTLETRMPAVRELVGLPIGQVDPLLVTGLACPRTPWGLQMIRRIDRVLSTPEGVAMLRDNLDRQWPKALQRPHAERIEAFFARRARPSDY